MRQWCLLLAIPNSCLHESQLGESGDQFVGEAMLRVGPLPLRVPPTRTDGARLAVTAAGAEPDIASSFESPLLVDGGALTDFFPAESSVEKSSAYGEGTARGPFFAAVENLFGR